MNHMFSGLLLYTQQRQQREGALGRQEVEAQERGVYVTTRRTLSLSLLRNAACGSLRAMFAFDVAAGQCVFIGLVLGKM